MLEQKKMPGTNQNSGGSQIDFYKREFDRWSAETPELNRYRQTVFETLEHGNLSVTMNGASGGTVQDSSFDPAFGQQIVGLVKSNTQKLLNDSIPKDEYDRLVDLIIAEIRRLISLLDPHNLQLALYSLFDVQLKRRERRKKGDGDTQATKGEAWVMIGIGTLAVIGGIAGVSAAPIIVGAIAILAGVAKLNGDL